ncbi:LRR receptor-like serine/threonine-protein kinase [Carex littledalei]|uniref:LRR receptor-like serine/threonine-protein kinase n=1 Tax=Carex littledalei TaxID=544730 RepID=A0A833R8J2_9POAL|nr:LRR receptor-like serine/threonine-protein kinase [Carex littledalei]
MHAWPRTIYRYDFSRYTCLRAFESEGSWLTVRMKNYNVTEMALWSLASSGLTGAITNAFANLKELQTLDLSDNNLTGKIPDGLSQLPSLTLLDLSGNQLNGSIPSSLLKKSQDGSLTLRVGDNAKLCSDGTSCNQSKKKSNSSKIAIAIIVPIVVVTIFVAVCTFIIYRLKRLPGLEYLHKGCNPPLIHRDVKPDNILLNAKLEAKIADFGLSRAFGNTNNTHISTTHVVGTLGYVDPE